MEFVPITITGVNEEASTQSHLSPAFMRIILSLTSNAPTGWADYFNNAWRQHIYMMKRHAECYGDIIVIECPPGELKQEHAPELKKVVDETNAAFARHFAATQTAQERAKQQQAAVAAELKSVSKDLKF